MNSLTIELACSGTTHRVTVGEDAISRARLIFHDHDRQAEQVMQVLGAEPPPCLAVPGQLATLAKLERSPVERARWLAVASPPAAPWPAGAGSPAQKRPDGGRPWVSSTRQR